MKKLLATIAAIAVSATAAFASGDVVYMENGVEITALNHAHTDQESCDFSDYTHWIHSDAIEDADWYSAALFMKHNSFGNGKQQLKNVDKFNSYIWSIVKNGQTIGCNGEAYKVRYTWNYAWDNTDWSIMSNEAQAELFAVSPLAHQTGWSYAWQGTDGYLIGHGALQDEDGNTIARLTSYAKFWRAAYLND